MYLSDRGTAFTARYTQRFLQKYGITQSTTPPYSPQTNSIVKRANGIIVATLKKAIDKNPNKWDELLPNTLLAINTTKQNSNRKSSFYLLHGCEPRLPCEHPISSFIDDTPRKDQVDLLTLVRVEAANNVYETHSQNKQRFDIHRRFHSFKAGDLVLYDWPKQGDHKLSPIFKGSFVIVRPVGDVCYEIKSTRHSRKNLSRLSTYNIFALTLNEIQQPSRKTAQTKKTRATEPLPKKY
ncbi:transposon Ty3-G Gag-Pol polyprotein [Trichonephila clavipes]|nr:transposon Ty3-G Gag-Pol polyprotein [Trichonephila clavipes]